MESLLGLPCSSGKVNLESISTETSSLADGTQLAPMKSNPLPKGPWIHRFTIRFFTLVLAILVYWILGFLVEDIQSIQGPDYETIEQGYLDQALITRDEKLRKELTTVERSIKDKEEEMRLGVEGSRNLQTTIGQLIELQKMQVEKAAPLAQEDQQRLSESLAHFFANQKAFQDRHAELSELMQKKRELDAEKRQVSTTLGEQREPAREEYQRLRERHDLRLAMYQLLILLPLLGVGAFLVARKRDSLYFPLFLGYGGAVLLKVTLVMHRYFPARYFKYILVTAMLLAVGRLLVHFIRLAAFPKTGWLNRQYREAYERFLCPVCEYPIRVGPRRFLFWTRRTVHKIALNSPSCEEEPYCCPACGTHLFEECSSCHQVRHSLLPHCQHCSATQPENVSDPESHA